jgi:hypothetical protein
MKPQPRVAGCGISKLKSKSKFMYGEECDTYEEECEECDEMCEEGWGEECEAEEECEEEEDCDIEAFRCVPRSWKKEKKEQKGRGTANAARVSRGSQYDTWDGLSVKKPTRDPRQHVTVTVVIYNTVAGGVPDVEDVLAAIDDMEQLYAACGWTGDLASEGAGFMKSALTVDDVVSIASKVSTQPYVPDNILPQQFDVFPVTDANPEPA